MLLRPFSHAHRGRLILVAVLSMLAVLFVFSATATERITDIGIYWHHFCGCAPAIEAPDACSSPGAFSTSCLVQCLA